MQIKTADAKTYIIRYERGKDVQKTEITDTTEDMISGMICGVISGRTYHRDARTGLIPFVSVKLYENNTGSGRMRLCRTYPRIFNLSPREVRIRVEKAVRERCTASVAL